MKNINPYKIILKRHFTEKAVVLGSLKDAESNTSVARCEKPKYVFIVHPDANKHQIAQAIEEIYKDNNVKVMKVNTVNVKSKPTRKRMGKTGRKAAFKKAVVTLETKDNLDNV